MAISKRLRFAILKRDKFTCQYCGRSAPGVVLHVDHRQSRKVDGPDDPRNLVTACADCNHGKADVPLVESSLGVYVDGIPCEHWINLAAKNCGIPTAELLFLGLLQSAVDSGSKEAIDKAFAVGMGHLDEYRTELADQIRGYYKPVAVQ